MHLKAVHLCNHLRKIERDIEEIEMLSNSLQKDRTYTPQLRSSLQEEVQKLNALREKILTQVIKDPPAFLKEDDNEGMPEKKSGEKK